MILEIKEKASKFLSKNFPNMEYSITDLNHMMIDDSHLDLSLARNWIETLAAKEVCKDPRRQGVDEKTQLQKLINSFDNFESCKRASLFLENGKLYDSQSIVTSSPPDCDGIIESDDGKIAAFTLKTTIGTGTAQNYQFKNVENFLSNSVRKNIEGPWVVAFLSGSFWTTKLSKYKNYFISGEGISKTPIEILKERFNYKKVIILTDEDLPNEKVNFFDYYRNNL